MQAPSYGDSNEVLLFKIASYYWETISDQSGLQAPVWGAGENALLNQILLYLARL